MIPVGFDVLWDRDGLALMQDELIDWNEFCVAYNREEWEKVNGLATVKHHIDITWSLLDDDESGMVDMGELSGLFRRLPPLSGVVFADFLVPGGWAAR